MLFFLAREGRAADINRVGRSPPVVHTYAHRNMHRGVSERLLDANNEDTQKLVNI